MKHTKECERESKKYEFIEAYYKQQWPGYCTHCRGWGAFITNFDPSPAGVSLGSGTMQDVDMCPHCLERNRCPRCGEFNIAWSDETFETDTCHHCGWSMEHPDGLPEPPECMCWGYCEKCGTWLDLMDEGPLCKTCETYPKKIDEYLNDPVFCPWCDSSKIEAADMSDVIGNTIFQPMICDDCDREWQEVHKLGAISWKPKGQDRIYSDEV